MAGLLAYQACRSLSTPTLIRYCHARRLLHTAPVDELFTDAPTSTPTPNPPAAIPSSAQRHTPVTQTKMSAERREELFNSIRERLTNLTGRPKAIKGPQARGSAWTHLIALATTPEQLQQVVDMFPRWRDTKRSFKPHVGNLLIRRCRELRCPRLALQVFCDHSKYAVPLSEEGARHLLYSLHRFYSIEDTLTASSLYAVYGLRPVLQDPTSCAAVIAGCLMHPDSVKALIIARALVPALQKVLEETKLPPLPADPAARGRDRPRAWLDECLRRIERRVPRIPLEGVSVDWAVKWRAENQVVEQVGTGPQPEMA